MHRPLLLLLALSAGLVAAPTLLALPTCEIRQVNDLGERICAPFGGISTSVGSPPPNCGDFFLNSECSTNGSIPPDMLGAIPTMSPDDERCDGLLVNEPGAGSVPSSLDWLLPAKPGAAGEWRVDVGALRLDASQPNLKVVFARLQVASDDYGSFHDLLDLALRPTVQGYELIALQNSALGVPTVIATLPLTKTFLRLRLASVPTNPDTQLQLCASGTEDRSCTTNLLTFSRPKVDSEPVKVQLGWLAADIGLPTCGGLVFTPLEPAGLGPR